MSAAVSDIDLDELDEQVIQARAEYWKAVQGLRARERKLYGALRSAVEGYEDGSEPVPRDYAEELAKARLTR